MGVSAGWALQPGFGGCPQSQPPPARQGGLEEPACAWAAPEKSPVLPPPTVQVFLWDLVFICPWNLPGINLAKLFFFFIFLRQLADRA